MRASSGCLGHGACPVKGPTLVAKNATRMGHPPVGMTELLREGIVQACREEFIEEEQMDARIERMIDA